MDAEESTEEQTLQLSVLNKMGAFITEVTLSCYPTDAVYKLVVYVLSLQTGSWPDCIHGAHKMLQVES